MEERVEGYAVPIHRTEVDGIPCFWADLPEEFEARLHVRVGAYDETLATRGATHLVEHLAISDTPFVPWEYAASVTGLFTMFSVVGSPEQVVDGLAAVCARLRELPLDRVPVTRRALLAEDSRTSSARRSLQTRYGARGPGLATYPEYGVRRITQDHLVAWTRDRFTAANAVLVLTGPPPPGLTCRLGDGARWLPTTPEPVPGDFPRLIGAADDRWGVSWLTAPSVAESAARDLLRARLDDALHYRLGLSYGDRRVAERLASTVVHTYLSGSFIEGYDDPVIELVLDEVRAFAESGPTADELALGRGWAEQYARTLDYGREWLDDLAEAELLGEEPLLANWADGYRALDEAQAAEALAGALPTLVVQSNTDIPAEELGLGTAPDWLHDPIEGTEFRLPPRLGRHSERLVVGDDAVSWVDGDSTSTIRLGDLAILTKEEGVRELIDLEGGRISVEAAELADGRRAFALIDALVPAELTVDLDVDGPEVPHLWLD